MVDKDIDSMSIISNELPTQSLIQLSTLPRISWLTTSSLELISITQEIRINQYHKSYQKFGNFDSNEKKTVVSDQKMRKNIDNKIIRHLKSNDIQGVSYR